MTEIRRFYGGRLALRQGSSTWANYNNQRCWLSLEFTAALIIKIKNNSRHFLLLSVFLKKLSEPVNGCGEFIFMGQKDNSKMIGVFPVKGGSLYQ